MREIDGQLVKLALHAIREPQRWERVLQHLIATTPAKAAIITLRDKTTCQIVNDDALVQEYHSPLIQGFSLESVAYYLEELRTIDPWAEAQRTTYPYRPTVMSTICHPNDVEDKRFFSWLEKEGLQDTVAFELDRVPGHWTAINLFLEHRETSDSHTLLEFCNLHFDLLRESWQSSQQMLRYKQSGDAALNQMSIRSRPACIITPNGAVFQKNSAFQNLQDNGAIKISPASNKLSICKNAEFYGDPDFDKTIVASHDSIDESCKAIVSPFEPDPLYKEKKDRYWLLSFGPVDGICSTKLEQVYELNVLLRQQRLFFDAVCDGANIAEAGKKVGVQRARAYVIWSEIRQKLELESVHELRGIIAILSQNIAI